MNTFSLKVIACDRVFFDGRCKQVILPLEDGQKAIQAHHENMAFAVEVGEIRIQEENGNWIYGVTGTGTIAQMLAPVAKKVIGVEIIPEAVEAAKENAKLNSLTNCEFIAGDVLKVIDEIEEKPDYIVLDPPRDGIHPKALEKIIRYGVPQMVYISCKPTSLARDLEVLQARGYEVKKVCCVDMFPATVHVESVVLMQYCGK